MSLFKRNNSKTKKRQRKFFLNIKPIINCKGIDDNIYQILYLKSSKNDNNRNHYFRLKNYGHDDFVDIIVQVIHKDGSFDNLNPIGSMKKGQEIILDVAFDNDEDEGNFLSLNVFYKDLNDDNYYKVEYQPLVLSMQNNGECYAEGDTLTGNPIRKSGYPKKITKTFNMLYK